MGDQSKVSDCLTLDTGNARPPAKIKIDRLKPTVSQKRRKKEAPGDGLGDLARLADQIGSVEEEPVVHQRPLRTFD